MIAYSYLFGGSIDEEALKQTLVDALEKMGVEADTTESVEALVAKILWIPQGDTTQEILSADTDTEFQVTLGYFSFGEEAQFTGMTSIAALCNISRLQVKITGPGASSLTISGDGWASQNTSTEDTEEITAVYAPAEGMNRFTAEEALDKLRIRGDEATDVLSSMQVSGFGYSGAEYPANGVARLLFRYGTTWELVEYRSLTWSDVENMTWSQFTQLGKS